MTTVEALVLDAGWEAIEPLLPRRHPAAAATPASTITPRWPASSTSLLRVLLDALGR